MLSRLLLTISMIGIILSGFSQTVISLKKKNGVFVVPCTVNGLKLEFIFDTGAADVSISLTEALFMFKNGYLSKKDVTGSADYQNASGEIEEGVVINLKEIEFAGIRLTNVKASIVSNLSAPLLLGQSAISKLGVIQIDFNMNTLTIIKDKKNNYISDQSTLEVLSSPLKDVDGNIYKAIKINNQIWTAENLTVSKYINGDKIQQANSNNEWNTYSQQSVGCWAYYKFDSAFKKYGKLYNWHAASDKRGLAPKGWRIPSDSDWTILIDNLGGAEVAANFLKKRNEWDKDLINTLFGFDALPAGAFSSPDEFIGIREIGFWWSISHNKELAWCRTISKGSANIERSEIEKSSGLSIRCIKD